MPVHHRDWCSRACRAALRRYGCALAPSATRQQQMARALEQRAAMAAQGYPLSDRFRQPPAG